MQNKLLTSLFPPAPTPQKLKKLKIHVCSYLVVQGPPEFLYVDWMLIQHKFNDLVQERHVWDVSCHPLSQPVKFLDTRDRAGYVFPRVGLRRQREPTFVTLQNTYIYTSTVNSQVTRIPTRLDSIKVCTCLFIQ